MTNLIDFKRLDIFQIYEWVTRMSSEGTYLSEDSRLVSCPVVSHPDRNPSCKLTRGRNLWYCFSRNHGGDIVDLVIAGQKHLEFLEPGVTERTAAIRWLCRATNLDWSGPLEQQPRAKHTSAKRFRRLTNEKLAGIYPYIDVDGELRYTMLRLVGDDDSGQPAKRFEYWRPVEPMTYRREWRIADREYIDDQGIAFTIRVIGGKTGDEAGWRYSVENIRPGLALPRHARNQVDGTPRIPYRAPELRTGIAAGRTVLFVEGERDADTLTTLGFVATTAAFGAGYHLDASWFPYFDGARSVLFIPDADDPGRSAAIRRANELAPAAPTSVLDLFAERNDSYDITDYVRERRTAGSDDSTIAAELRHLLQRTRTEPRGAYMSAQS